MSGHTEARLINTAAEHIGQIFFTRVRELGDRTFVDEGAELDAGLRPI